MALPERHLWDEENLLLSATLRIVPDEGPPSDLATRTCTSCGHQGPFRFDPAGSWSECPRCGHYQ